MKHARVRRYHNPSFEHGHQLINICFFFEALICYTRIQFLMIMYTSTSFSVLAGRTKPTTLVYALGVTQLDIDLTFRSLAGTHWPQKQQNKIP
ncbi:hypothetical protein VNO78_30687 [Psophocarpus tetragonolobus]|uniref:Uncharacterized protein n=1 Tax=Psophocarpus tetragonolobus TaxID=3891 RepID=A0AAN9RXC9_PSOTE